MSLFSDIRFPVGRINEDTCTTYKVLLKTVKYICLGNILYYFRIRQTSITHSDFSKKRLEIVKIPDEMRYYLGNEVIKYVDEIDYYEFRLRVYLYNLLVRSDKDRVYESDIEALRIYIINTDNIYIGIKYAFVKKLLKYNKCIYKYIVKNIWKK